MALHIPQNKKPGFPGFLLVLYFWRIQSPFRFLRRADVRGLIPLGAGRFVETDLLPFFERFEAGILDCGEMGKEIFASIIRRDESETLRVVEPLNGTCSHVFVFLKN